MVSSWSSWGSCSSVCGHGWKTRNRSVTIEASCGGAACPTYLDDESPFCYTFVCPKQLVFSSTEEAAELRGGWLGEYTEEGVHNERPYYRQRDDSGETDKFLFYDNNGWGSWMVGPKLGEGSGGLRHTQSSQRPAEARRSDEKQVKALEQPSSPFSHYLARPVAGSDDRKYWQYWDGEEWQADDKSLHLQWAGLEPCRSVEVAAMGEAAVIRQESMGAYLPTGQWRHGRPIYRKTEGGTRYLMIANGGWSVVDTLEATSFSLEGGRGTLSPGHPATGPSLYQGWQGWRYWAGKKWKDSKGELTVTCQPKQ